MTNLYGLLPGEIEALVTEAGAPRFRSTQLLDALYRQSPDSLADVAQWPRDLRERAAEKGYGIDVPMVVRRSANETGDTTKLLLSFPPSTLIETVLMQYPAEESDRHPRSTVCVSSQAGCAMGCTFCATGQMGFERNLSAADIVLQVVHFQRLLRERGEHVTNVVFMGMGEPLANYHEVIRAVRILTDPRAFGLGQRHITVSTVGIVNAIDRLAGEDLQVGLAISLHAPNDALRQSLVPTATPDSVQRLVEAGDRYAQKTGRRVSYEYTLLGGVNDSPELGRDLGRLLRGRLAHVNLIPVNPTMGPFDRPSREAVRRFRQDVEQAGGIACTVRIEKGSDIAAACGQLRTDHDARQKAAIA